MLRGERSERRKAEMRKAMHPRTPSADSTGAGVGIRSGVPRSWPSMLGYRMGRQGDWERWGPWIVHVGPRVFMRWHVMCGKFLPGNSASQCERWRCVAGTAAPRKDHQLGDMKGEWGARRGAAWRTGPQLTRWGPPDDRAGAYREPCCARKGFRANPHGASRPVGPGSGP